MSYKLSFGKYEGHSYEWLFFKAPWYADWIYMKDIHRQPHNFSEEEGSYFRELYRRASHLAGVCPHCQKRPISRLGYSTDSKTCMFAHVGLYCDACEAQGRVVTTYHLPSFFIEGYMPARRVQLAIAKLIKHHYIGAGSLTQAKMEQFFRNDENFENATPGWFDDMAMKDRDG